MRLALVALLIAGCAETPRYQFIAAGGHIVRADTKTGDLRIYDVKYMGPSREHPNGWFRVVEITRYPE